MLLFCTSIYADNSNAYSKTGERLFDYMRAGDGKLLVVRNNYGYMTFTSNFKKNGYALYLMEMTDNLMNTGAKPNQKKYMEVLVNIMATYESDQATDIAKQQELDNLKTLKDYAMDCGEMGEDVVSILSEKYPSASKFESVMTKAIDGLGVLADNTKNWTSALSDFEIVIRGYSEHEQFLKRIEENSQGELKKAAKTLREGMSKAMTIKLDTYQEITEQNYKNYEEFFFSDVFFDAVKQTSEYAKDSSFKFFADIGDEVSSKIALLKSSWNLGKKIGTMVGDVVIGGEDLINRVLEMEAIYDISEILQGEVLEVGNNFLLDFGKKEEENYADTYVSLSQYLIGCRIRGEYCIYSIVAKNAGLLSWFGKKSAREAEQWYEDKTKKLLSIQNHLLKILEKDTKEEQNQKKYQLYADKIQQYELKYGKAKLREEEEGYSYMTGLCFMKLVDFSQNGEELFLVYETESKSDGNILPDYIFEIWGWKNGGIILLDSGNLFGTDGGVKHVILTKVGQKTYLVTGSMDDFGYYYFHGYSNGEFSIVREVLLDENEDLSGYICSINGESVSYNTYQNEQKKWFKQYIEYTLNEDSVKVRKQNEETKETLKHFRKGHL